jgi:hypothetical protein
LHNIIKLNKKLEMKKMEDSLGMGNTANIKGESRPLGCQNSATSNMDSSGWACNRVDCPSYGKWYCPFSW